MNCRGKIPPSRQAGKPKKPKRLASLLKLVRELYNTPASSKSLRAGLVKPPLQTYQLCTKSYRAIDPVGRLAGSYDTTHNGANGGFDTFVLKLSSDARIGGTFIGGSDRDYGYELKLDSAGNPISSLIRPDFNREIGPFFGSSGIRSQICHSEERGICGLQKERFLVPRNDKLRFFTDTRGTSVTLRTNS